jgi:plasmid stabilization system protein ParE
MVKIVKVNKKATRRISTIAEYLEYEYSYQTATKFVILVYKTIDKVAEYPSRGRKIPASKTLQFINIDAHRQLFYRVHGTTLSVVDVFDTRQNPIKRPSK